MKLTKSKLKQLIKEELNALNELGIDWEEEVRKQKGLSALTRAEADKLLQQFAGLQGGTGTRDVDPGDKKGYKAHITYNAALGLIRQLILLLEKSPDAIANLLDPDRSTQLSAEQAGALAALAAYRKNL